jgi:LysR family glycine cleavage system transcriptional activator
MLPLPLTGLRAFEAAARHLSFRAAAAELRVTPTAVSHAVAQLERQAGITLFRRRPRPLALTEAGAALLPPVRDGFEAMAAALAGLAGATNPLRVTCTNAFAARWLLPRLPAWRATNPAIALEILGTDAVLDLTAGQADLAIRYARHPPPGAETLGTDRFRVVASPALIAGMALPLAPAAIAALPRIAIAWPASDAGAPTWARWEQATGAPPGRAALSFAEELHGIEAALAGQGVAILSDVLVADALADGRLVAVSDLALPGYGFHLLCRDAAPAAAAAVTGWLREGFAPPTPPSRRPRSARSGGSISR